jgi:hypothetical protein
MPWRSRTIAHWSADRASPKRAFRLARAPHARTTCLSRALLGPTGSLLVSAESTAVGLAIQHPGSRLNGSGLRLGPAAKGRDSNGTGRPTRRQPATTRMHPEMGAVDVLVSETMEWRFSRRGNNGVPSLACDQLLGLHASRFPMLFSDRQLAHHPRPNKDPVSIRNSPFQRLEPISNRCLGRGFIDGLDIHCFQRIFFPYVPVPMLLHVYVQPDLEPGFGVDQNDPMIM